MAKRHLTALRRPDLSRPVLSTLRDGLLRPDRSFFDYGCGHGDDVRRLREQGFECGAWDPLHHSDGEKQNADVVNLGYVVNVIEDPKEREETLRNAWRLTAKVLTVAARLETEISGRETKFGDGLMTKRGTFQKFFNQTELRDWIDETLQERSVAAAPGIFYVFRSAAERESFTASRFRSLHAAPRVRRSDEIYEANREILDRLSEFLNERGRLPAIDELPEAAEIESRIGSLRRAFGIIERVTGAEDWVRVREERSQELLIYLALARFRGRPKASELPTEMQLDVKAFFGSYRSACTMADKVLFSAGDPAVIEKACKKSQIGKSAGPALYAHLSALSNLDPVLRVYEGCARAYIGTVEGANIVKLHRDEPRISYLAYPDFDKDPHPALSRSLVVHLQTFRIRETDFERRENPPILHRKEEFLASEHPLRPRFHRLTRQEERHGLFEEANRIGTRDRWNDALKQRGLALRGHRLVRVDKEAAAEDSPSPL